MSTEEDVNQGPKLESSEPTAKLSLSEQLAEARRNSDNAFSFLMSAFAIISVTAGCTVLMILLLLFPIFVFIVGVTNLGDCPVNPWIPIYLLVLGAIAIFSNLSFLSRSCCNEKIVTCLNCLQLPLNAFVIVWFILGNIWVYGSLDEVDTQNATIIHKEERVENPDYCDYLTYWLAFWLITLVYLVIIITVVAGIATLGVLRKRGNEGEEEPIVAREQ